MEEAAVRVCRRAAVGGDEGRNDGAGVWVWKFPLTPSQGPARKGRARLSDYIIRNLVLRAPVQRTHTESASPASETAISA